MNGRPSDDEMQRRIAALLMSPTAGQAVARRLEGQKEEERAYRAAVADLRAKRLDAVCRRTVEGLDRLEAANVPTASILLQKAQAH